jgi:hypothetical protein
MAGWNRTRPRAAMRLDGATGLARAEASARYARAVRTSRAGWDACPPRMRMAALVDAVNAELAHVSASPAVALLHELPPFTTPRRAWFLRGAWCVLFDPHALDDGLGDEELGRVASAAYHEARHVEQTFRVARKLAAEGAGARQIELQLGIPAEIAAAAAELPLTADDQRPWDEAAAWQEDIARSDSDEPSRADTAADLLDEAIDAYARARAAYRWAAEPASPGRSGRAALRADYVRTRERVRRLYALHDGLAFERDAWATAALVQQHLGFDPGSPADVLAGLDDDERSLRADRQIKTGLASTSGASA